MRQHEQWAWGINDSGACTKSRATCTSCKGRHGGKSKKTFTELSVLTSLFRCTLNGHMYVQVNAEVRGLVGGHNDRSAQGNWPVQASDGLDSFLHSKVHSLQTLLGFRAPLALGGLQGSVVEQDMQWVPFLLVLLCKAAYRSAPPQEQPRVSM